MPTIPGTEESQVLNVGSPVPIGSSEGSRALGEAAAGFGRGLFALGDALDTAAKERANRAAKIRMNVASAEYSEASVDAKIATAAEAADAGDETGQGAVNRYRARMREVRSRISSNLYNTEEQQAFLSKAAQDDEKVTLDLWATELKKLESRDTELLNVAVGKWTDVVRKNPGDIAKAWNGAAGIFADIPGVSPAELEKGMVKAKREIVLAGVDSLVDTGNIPEAKRLMYSKYGDVFDVKERREQLARIESIHQDRVKFNNYKIDTRRQEDEILFKKNSQKMLTEHISQIQATQDVSYTEIVLNSAREDMQQGRLAESDYNFLTKIVADKETRLDSRAELFLVDKLDKGHSIDQVQDYLKKLAGGGDISGPNASAMWFKLEGLKQRQRNSQEHTRALTESIKILQQRTFGELSVADRLQIQAGILPDRDAATISRWRRDLKELIYTDKDPLSVVDGIAARAGSNVPFSIKGITFKDSDPDEVLKAAVDTKIKTLKTVQEQRRMLEEFDAEMERRKQKRSSQQQTSDAIQTEFRKQKEGK